MRKSFERVPDEKKETEIWFYNPTIYPAMTSHQFFFFGEAFDIFNSDCTDDFQTSLPENPHKRLLKIEVLSIHFDINSRNKALYTRVSSMN
jgi:hypothetical protein